MVRDQLSATDNRDVVRGLFVLSVVSVAAFITALPQASANMAFVRTGIWAARVYRDGRCAVVPR